MKVSVVLCTFNGELFIEAQLQSIARQTRVPDELIILDDQSTDSTVEIAKSVCASSKIHAVIEINETRLEAEENFSRAMSKASGDVIFFCDQRLDFHAGNRWVGLPVNALDGSIRLHQYLLHVMG